MTTSMTPDAATAPQLQALPRELTTAELDAVGGAWNIHAGNSTLGFSLTGDGLTVCVAGNCGTIWWDDLKPKKA